MPATEEPCCRFCGTRLEHTFVDLGMSPLCQKHLRASDLSKMEPFYPLHVWVCSECFLVQLEEFVPPEEIFGDGEYAYFSSYSSSWLDHARRYVERMRETFSIDARSFVVEIASNDGYLLQYFQARHTRVLGIEPASNTAAVARERGIETLVRFFGRDVAREVAAASGRADLIVANNVIAHVPDINDFVAGLAILLAGEGVLTLEFPHLQRLVEGNQFDTIYHEHFSYLSFGTIEQILARHGLVVFDVEELPTHGGSLRVYGRHAGNETRRIDRRVDDLRAREIAAGMRTLAYHSRFGERVQATKRKLLSFLISARNEGRTIVGYGAPGKGNTLLNYCGIRSDFLDYTVDRSPHKQGGFLPGTHIPIKHPDEIARTRPDYLLILPWNLKEEIMEQMAGIRDWNGRFVVPIPEVRVLP
ncbi:MAG TPA: class I SAM-dependent methyltransferase [Deltaproteobacteria bacterium]|nr:class I SAM-dependent methyltransferase [Deltaproteobacteria bacterium]